MTTVVISSANADEMLSLIGDGWERSTLFRFLREHHDRILERQAGERMNWKALCGWFLASNLTNRRGSAPTPSCARKTWYRVRKYVAKRRLEARAEAERRALEQAEEEARKEARKAAVRAERSRTEAEAAAIRRKFENTQRASQWAREREEMQSVTPRASASVGPENAPGERSGAGRIGEVAPVFKMLQAAPLYGEDARKPAPPPYVGPRPAGMPDNLPLEALVSLEATGRDQAGKIDYGNMPGLPRRSFFKSEFEWAQCCLLMIRAIPPSERSGEFSLMFSWLRSYPGILSSIPGMR